MIYKYKVRIPYLRKSQSEGHLKKEAVIFRWQKKYLKHFISSLRAVVEMWNSRVETIPWEFLGKRSPGMDAWFPPLSSFPDFILFLRYIFSENALNLDILAAEELGVQCTCFKVLERSSSLGSSVRFCFQVMSFRYRSVRLSATLWHITYYHDTGLEKYHFNIFRNETTLLFVWDWWFLLWGYVRPSA